MPGATKCEICLPGRVFGVFLTVGLRQLQDHQFLRSMHRPPVPMSIPVRPPFKFRIWKPGIWNHSQMIESICLDIIASLIPGSNIRNVCLRPMVPSVDQCICRSVRIFLRTSTSMIRHSYGWILRLDMISSLSLTGLISSLSWTLAISLIFLR